MATGQIVRARRHLAHDEDRAVAIHEARKCLKRVRALLRLMRPALTKEQYRRENARFRDIARLLSTSRDSHVMRETVAQLAADATGEQSKALAALRDVVNKHTADEVLPHDLTQALETAIAALGRAKRDVKHLDLHLNMKDAIRIGLARSYRSGQEAMLAARANSDSEALHDWRKMVQVHWRHMALLSEPWPEYFAVRSTAAKQLSDWLGEEHDLAVLINFVSNGAGSSIGSVNAEAIAALALERQLHLRRQAFHKGAYLFADDAQELASTIQRYWSVARDQSRDADDAVSDHGGGLELAKTDDGKSMPVEQ